MEGKILVCGDIHGEWGYLNKLISRHKPSIILQCGDWGWWPKLHDTYSISTSNKYSRWNQYGIKNIYQNKTSAKIYWCPGNHEDWWSLLNEMNSEIPIEIQKDIFYMKRRQILTLPDGRNVLFMGGAESIDKHFRKIGWDWFPEETISNSDIYNLPNVKIDIVISHTCPIEFQDELLSSDAGRCMSKFKDPSMIALSYVLDKYKPEKWYFGHFHFFRKGKSDGVEWTCLNMAPNEGWWDYMK